MLGYLKFADFILMIAKLLTILIMAGMLISVLIGIFFRFVIPLPIAWPPEAARFMMVAVTMIGSSIAVRQLEHVGITLFVDVLPRNLAFGLYVLVNILVAIFLVVFTWYSLKLTFQMGPRQFSSSIGVNMAYAYLSMPIGGMMMLIQVIAAVFEGAKRNRNGHSPFAASPAQSAI